MLTAAQRKRLAREARKLARECVEGTAPRLGARMAFTDDGPHCAMGVVFHRAGLTELDYIGSVGRELVNLGGCEVADANDSATDEARSAAVVFPLLALADALEEAAP